MKYVSGDLTFNVGASGEADDHAIGGDDGADDSKDGICKPYVVAAGVTAILVTLMLNHLMKVFQVTMDSMVHRSKHDILIKDFYFENGTLISAVFFMFYIYLPIQYLELDVFT